MKTISVKINENHYKKEFPDERGLKELTPQTTGRGFQMAVFEDLYGQRCSIQNSSLATEGAIWIGVDNTGPNLDGPSGKRNEEISARMHLTRKQVQELLPLLMAFAKKSYFDEKDIPKKIRG